MWWIGLIVTMVISYSAFAEPYISLSCQSARQPLEKDYKEKLRLYRLGKEKVKEAIKLNRIAPIRSYYDELIEDITNSPIDEESIRQKYLNGMTEINRRLNFFFRRQVFDFKFSCDPVTLTRGILRDVQVERTPASIPFEDMCKESSRRVGRTRRKKRRFISEPNKYQFFTIKTKALHQIEEKDKWEQGGFLAYPEETAEGQRMRDRLSHSPSSSIRYHTKLFFNNEAGPFGGYLPYWSKFEGESPFTQITSEKPEGRYCIGDQWDRLNERIEEEWKNWKNNVVPEIKAGTAFGQSVLDSFEDPDNRSLAKIEISTRKTTYYYDDYYPKDKYRCPSKSIQLMIPKQARMEFCIGDTRIDSYYNPFYKRDSHALADNPSDPETRKSSRYANQQNNNCVEFNFLSEDIYDSEGTNLDDFFEYYPTLEAYYQANIPEYCPTHAGCVGI